MALIQFYWKYKENKSKNPNISIIDVSPIQGAINNVRNSIFRQEDKLLLNILIRNYGDKQVQILYMHLWVRSKKDNRFYMFPLGHSEEYKKINKEDRNEFGKCLEIIDIVPNSTMQRQYLINVGDGGSTSHAARKRDKKAYIEANLSNGEVVRRWLSVIDR